MHSDVKAMLRKKNRLLHKGRVEEASALARCIGNEITRRTKTELSLLHENVDSREMLACVRRLTGKQKNVGGPCRRHYCRNIKRSLLYYFH